MARPSASPPQSNYGHAIARDTDDILEEAVYDHVTWNVSTSSSLSSVPSDLPDESSNSGTNCGASRISELKLRADITDQVQLRAPDTNSNHQCNASEREPISPSGSSWSAPVKKPRHELYQLPSPFPLARGPSPPGGHDHWHTKSSPYWRESVPDFDEWSFHRRNASGEEVNAVRK